VIPAIFTGRGRARTSKVQGVSPDPLDNVVWAALTGPQARFAQRLGRAARFEPDVSPFLGMADTRDPAAWADLVALVGPGQDLFVAGADVLPPPGWSRVGGMGGVQMTGADVEAVPDPEAVRLGEPDIPEILDLVARTEPGPFRKRTIDLGSYLGIRRGGALIALAGERLKVPGWTEVSAVCTDPAYRGQGLAGRLVRAVTAGIRERGEQPFLHAAATNIGAIRLYEKLGFRIRTKVIFGVYRSGEDDRGSSAER
jgi:ribosomal protein S18 acetylase RimI-like enzyme